MEKGCFAIYSTLLVLTGSAHMKSDAGYVDKFGGSRYIFYESSGRYSWSESEKICEKSGHNLTSIESREEWNFLNQTIQRKKTIEYFIGLRKDTTGVWRWLSDNSTLNVSSKGVWPWAIGEPSNTNGIENCAQMYKQYGGHGRYNDVSCFNSKREAGFICECKEEEVLTDESQASKAVPVKKSPAATTATHLEHYSSEPSSTLKHRPSTDLSTKGLKSHWITFGNTVTKNQLDDDVGTRKPNLVVIVVVLSAIFILIIVVAFGPMFFRRRRYRSHNKQCKDHAMCSYEKPSSAAQTSVDAVLVQQTQSSAELTVHLTLSRTASDLVTYGTVSECRNECEYDDIDDTHRKSRSVSEEFLDVQERARKNSVVSGERGIKQPPSFHDEKEKNKDHVYAVVHKKRKGRACSEGGALKKSSDRPQKRTSGLPVKWASCVEIEHYIEAAMNETLQAGDNGEHLYEVVNNTNKKDHDCAAAHKQRGLKDYTKTAMNETPQAGENAEYLYAVVDKRNNKKKAPQVPTPYRGLVYPVLVHSRENSS